MPSTLLIGRNGAGKSSISLVLQIIQKIGRGINRISQLVQSQDFTRGRSDVPIRFEIEVLLKEELYKYTLALELPSKFKEPRVSEEKLLVAGEAIYSRKEAEVTLYQSSQNREAQFLVDWHIIALPLIQEQSEADPLYIFKTWLKQMIILAPMPSLMTGEAKGETLEPVVDGSNFGEWLVGLLAEYPAAYTQIANYLQKVMPDLQDFKNPKIGKDYRGMIVNFVSNNITLSVDFDYLSDGEKCFFLCAIVLAANKFYGPVFCFWDEPDNYLSLSEIGHFIVSLRRSFKNGGQILVTSHNEETIRKFSDENTFVLDRKSHLEPTLIRLLRDTSVKGDLVDTLIRGDIEL
jgi:predicted ATPase